MGNGPTPDGRCSECGKDQKREENVYVGKAHLPPSWAGGGWGGPKEGHDKDERYMLRGEARQLPEDIYQPWKDKGRLESSIEQSWKDKMAVVKRVMKGSESGSDSDS